MVLNKNKDTKAVKIDNLTNKIKKIYLDTELKKNFFEFLTDIKYFSFNVALWRLLCHLPVVKAKFPKIYNWFHGKFQASIKKFLFLKCRNVFEEFNSKSFNVQNENLNDDKNIWVFWWQGNDSAPLLVQNCIESIKINSGVKNVYVLSKVNFKNYVNIPNYIINKFEKGEIGPAHFSDILRMALLYQKGGIWIDATVYCSKKIPEDYFEYTLFTCRNTKEVSYDYNHFSWTPFILGTPKDSKISKLFLDCLLTYWKDQEKAIDYLFLDVILELIYENVPVVKIQMDNLSCNNENVMSLYKEMKSNEPFSKNRLIKLLDNETVFYKLTWKSKFKEVSNDGQVTLYNYFLHNFNQFHLK